MQVGIRVQTQELYAKIIEDYYEGPLSIKALKAKYGRSESAIAKVLAQYKLNNPDRQRSGKPADPRHRDGKKCLSVHHFQVSMAITRYMTENKLSPTAFGHLISKSRVDVRNMEVGAYNLTLLDIERIAEVLGYEFELLLTSQKESRLNVVAA